MKNVYLVRHCEAAGQEPESPLTEDGEKQARDLAAFFQDKDLDFIMTSPFERARKSVQPLANLNGLPIHSDDRLRERTLTSKPHPDWLKLLDMSFMDLDESFMGGESSQFAMERGAQVLQEFLASSKQNGVFVTHGNLLTLILKHFDQQFGFNDWKSLLNPDVFQLSFEDKEAVPEIKRIWIK